MPEKTVVSTPIPVSKAHALCEAGLAVGRTLDLGGEDCEGVDVPATDAVALRAAGLDTASLVLESSGCCGSVEQPARGSDPAVMHEMSRIMPRELKLAIRA